MRLECKNCKTVFTDVEKMEKCTLCGKKIFENADKPTVVPKWHEYHGIPGFFDPAMLAYNKDKYI